MNRRYIWVAAATLMVLVQAYMFPVFGPKMPSLLVVSLLVTSIYFEKEVLLICALGWGLILDVASMGLFGLNMFTSLVAAVLIWWLLQRGLSKDSLLSVGLIVSVAVCLLLAVELAVLLLTNSLLIDAGLWFETVFWQLFTTVVFAWLASRHVQLEV